MDMQDKEIDELFSSGFQDFEVEPSKNVWPGIISRLEAGRRKRMPYLSIAASLLILLTTGLYFITREKVEPKKPVKVVLTQNNKPVKSIIAAKPVIIENDAQPVSHKPMLTAKTVRPAKLKEKDMIITAPDKATLTAQVPEIQPAEQLTQLTPKHEAITQFVVPSAEIPLSVKTETPEEPTFITKAVLTAQAPQADKTIVAAPAKKRRIRSLGDLINVVVSKVDKRKDKVIEFTNTDDDEATITGINLGFIKIKKQD
jgi:hypothetical protein